MKFALVNATDCFPYITLAYCHQENGSVPENKIISAALAKEASLKKYMKRVMPFVQVVKVSSLYRWSRWVLWWLHQQ